MSTRLLMALLATVAMIGLALPCYADLAWKDDDKTIDYGLFDVKKAVTYEYKNAGTAPITFTRCQKACACLLIAYSRKPIQPGASGKVVATYMAEETDCGEVSMGFALTTSTGKRHTLTLLARVAQPMTLGARAVTWTLNERAREKRVELIVNPKLKSVIFGPLSNTNSLALAAAIVDGPKQKTIRVTPKWTDAKLRAFLRFTVSYTGPKGRVFKKAYKVRVAVR